jgi:protein ImuA
MTAAARPPASGDSVPLDSVSALWNKIGTFWIIDVMRMEPAHRARSGETCAGVTSFRQGDHAAPLIEALRAHIARLEHSHAQFDRQKAKSVPWVTGLAGIDRHLPAQGLARGGLHDVSPREHGDQPAAMGFALALALRRLADSQERRPLLWCRLGTHEREYGRLYGHGLERLGLPRHRLVTITLRKPASLLWTMEEALKSGAVAAAIGDADAAHAGLTVTRRLSLAAHAGKSAAILTFAKADASATASHTRWTAAAVASRSPPHDALAVGSPCWSIELTRARGGRPGAWILEWHHAQSRFSLVPGFSRRTLHPDTDQDGAEAAAQGPALRAG